MQNAIEYKVEQMIYVIRGQKVMLDNDLAELYGVKTKVLNQAVKRNRDRFPSDFMLQLENKHVNLVLGAFFSEDRYLIISNNI